MSAANGSQDKASITLAALLEELLYVYQPHTYRNIISITYYYSMQEELVYAYAAIHSTMTNQIMQDWLTAGCVLYELLQLLWAVDNQYMVV